MTSDVKNGCNKIKEAMRWRENRKGTEGEKVKLGDSPP